MIIGMNRSVESLRLRPATAADVAQLCALLALLFEQEADFLPDPAKQERGLRMILDDPATGMIFCAEHPDEGVIGMVSILFSVSTAEGGRVAWLEDMVVRPDWRGRGIGVSLLDLALAAARGAGCLRVTLLTDLTNGDAMRFYARSGFSRSAMTPMRLKF
jgi:GNAT superfamily N-acetyltransferase